MNEAEEGRPVSRVQDLRMKITLKDEPWSCFGVQPHSWRQASFCFVASYPSCRDPERWGPCDYAASSVATC